MHLLVNDGFPRINVGFQYSSSVEDLKEIKEVCETYGFDPVVGYYYLESFNQGILCIRHNTLQILKAYPKNEIDVFLKAVKKNSNTYYLYFYDDYSNSNTEYIITMDTFIVKKILIDDFIAFPGIPNGRATYDHLDKTVLEKISKMKNQQLSNDKIIDFSAIKKFKD